MITAIKLISDVSNYKKKNKKTLESSKHSKIRVYLGIDSYPNQCNLSSKFGLYKYSNYVAFFANQLKIELYFVLGILMGSYSESYELIKKIYGGNAGVCWDDIIEYLADMKRIYFLNYNDMKFGSFDRHAGNKAVDYLVFSTSLKNEIKNLNSTNSCTFLLHPGPRNFNSHPSQWFDTYVLLGRNNGTNGNAKLSYFEI